MTREYRVDDLVDFTIYPLDCPESRQYKKALENKLHKSIKNKEKLYPKH